MSKEEKQMPTNVNDKIRKLTSARRKKVEARAAQLIAAYERGEFKPVKNQKGAKQTALMAARSYERLTGSILSGKKEG